MSEPKIEIQGVPQDVAAIRHQIRAFLNAPAPNGKTIGNAKWGVYAFYDYDGEPIYVGQTNEMLRTRIRRHLTNQRTDAVAMNVLDPFEVAEIQVWPLWELQERNSRDADAKAIHRGRTTWLWDIEMRNDDGKLCATSRVTIAVRDAPA